MAETVLPGLRRALGEALGRHAKRQPIEAPLIYKREYLQEIDVFRDLSADEMTWLAESTRMVTIPAGEMIYHQHDAGEGLLLLKQGRVRLSRLTSTGKKLDLVVLEPGAFFGEMPLLGQRMHGAMAEAIKECMLCVMRQEDIEQLIRRQPDVALRMLAALGRRLAESEARLEDLAYRSVSARLASALLRLSETPDGQIEDTTHQDLGDLIGAYRETVTKTLDDFKKAGYVEVGRRRVRVLDRRGLAALIDE